MPRRILVLRFACLVLAASVLPCAALAAGFEYGPQGVHAVGRGGAFVLGADDPSAIWWNPSKVAFLRGTQLMINDNITRMKLDFDRDPAAKYQVDGKGNLTSRPELDSNGDPVVRESGRTSEQTHWFPLGASLGLTSDFGLKDWGFGLGICGPSAYGTVRYPDKAPLNKDDPTLASGTRYSVTDMNALLLMVSLAAAYKYKDYVGLGFALQYVAVPYIKYSLDIISPGPAAKQNDPAYTLNDMRVEVDMSDWKKFSVLLGGWGRPLPFLELGFSARIFPIPIRATGNLYISGTENSLYPTKAELAARTPAEKPVKVPGSLSFTYPADVKVGARYLHKQGDREVFDIEADFVWEQWSAMDSFKMKFDVNEVEAYSTTLILNEINLPRNQKDTYSVRLGGTYNAIPDHLWARLGGWWESGSQPLAYTTVDLPSWDRFGIGLGLSGAYRGFELGISYAHVFQMSRNVKSGKVYQQILDFEGNVRNGYAVNEGKYTGSYDILSVGLTILWEELIYGKKPGARAAAN